MAHRIVHVGWDGASSPILEAEQPCGCRWTTDLRVKLRSCTACLSAACRKEQRDEWVVNDAFDIGDESLSRSSTTHG